MLFRYTLQINYNLYKYKVILGLEIKINNNCEEIFHVKKQYNHARLQLIMHIRS